MILFCHQPGTKQFTDRIIKKLENKKFFDDAAEIKDFDPRYTSPLNINGQDILRPLIESEEIKVFIGFYTQRWISWKFRPVNAYVDHTGRRIFINRRQKWRSLKDWEETIFHELTHVSDSIDHGSIYGHGDNNLSGKSETAPVKFAKWAARWNI